MTLAKPLAEGPLTLNKMDGGLSQGRRVIFEDSTIAEKDPTVWQVTMEQSLSL